MSALAPCLQKFFTKRLTQRGVSAHTVAAYRDSLRMLVAFASQNTGKPPSSLDFADLDAKLVGEFLQHLEQVRGNGVRTRNHRLAAVHAFFSYAALEHPEHAADIQRVLAIPTKRTMRNLVTYLTPPEVDALLDACEESTWTGRRDQALLLLAVQSGLRISELVALDNQDVVLTVGPHVHCRTGKGRKERRTPLVSATVAVLQAWRAERQGGPSDPLFPTVTGRRLSRDAVEHRITHYTTKAAEQCSTLKGKHVTAHTLRHTCAMRLLSSGIDVTVIALWLGHEQVSTTQVYLHADMAQKERAIAATRPPTVKPGRFQAPDSLMAFLEGL